MQKIPKTVRMSENMISHLEALACKDNRRFAPMVEILLQEAIDARSVQTEKPATD